MIIEAANIYKITWENMIMSLYFYNDTIIEYLNISLEKTLEVCNAPSPGSYLNIYIKNNYSYRRVK